MPFRMLRDALWQLSLEPDEQRKALQGTAVTDELALDLDYAVTSLRHASEQAGLNLSEDIMTGLAYLTELLLAPPEAPLWDDEALDRHPVWAEARTKSRALLPLLP